MLSQRALSLTVNPSPRSHSSQLLRLPKLIGLSSILLFFTCTLKSVDVGACEHYASDQLVLCVDYFEYSMFRLPQVDRTLFNAQTETFFTKHADNVMRQMNELHINADWAPAALENGPLPAKFHLELRPWYDTSYLMTGSGQGQYAKYLDTTWETNMQPNMADQYAPLIREYYVDLTPKHFFIRIGRQTIPWGKSDGVYMLDVLNNFQLSNPTIFNEQLIKIPVWAINANWFPTTTGSLQVVWEPQYFVSYYPGLPIKGGLPTEGGYQDWTYGSVAYFNNIENGLFGVKFPVNYHEPDFTLKDSVPEIRWGDTIADVHYTLNYLYTYTSFPITFPNTGNFTTATAYREKPTRIHVVGGSGDYEISTENWLDGSVLRVESAMTIDDQYYEGIVGNPKYVTHWGLLAGFDKQVLTDYLARPVFFSLQYWQDWVVNSVHCGNCGADDHRFQDAGFQGGKSGMREIYKDIATLYLDKTWLDGDIVDSSFAAVYELQYQDLWLQPRVQYRYNDNFTFAVGFNIFTGGRQQPYGEFTNNTDAFFEIHYSIL